MTIKNDPLYFFRRKPFLSQKILQEEKPFWEVDKNAGKSPVLLLNAKNDINEVSWEEPENIISIHELAPQINFNSAILERIIHLDFKGAPLKIEYLEKLFPKLAEWGATGLMIEYEDTFPYDGEFESVKDTDLKFEDIFIYPFITLL